MSLSNVAITLSTNVGETFISNALTTSIQQIPRRCDSIVTASLCLLGDAKNNEVAVEIFWDNLEAEVNLRDISTKHRIAKSRENSRNSCPPILKCVSCNVRSNVKDKHLAIHESLTDNIMKLLRKRKEQHGVKNVWSRMFSLQNNQ